MHYSQIPVLKPLLPKSENIQKYLKLIDDTRIYTNRGPLTQRFEAKLADHFRVAPGQIITVSNGTLALSVALMALNNVQKNQYCLMPSWTFVATPAAAQFIGLKPVFIDVELDTWSITPSSVLKGMNELKIKKEDVHSVIPVSPFGHPLNVSEWIDFEKRTGIKVLFDAAASFDTITTSEVFAPSSIPTMISLHATKVFGVGEGAVIISKDEEIITNIKKRINFGFYGSREASVLGINAKISEYTSAVGLAELDQWESKRNKWDECTKNYVKYASKLISNNIQFFPNFGTGWISSYCNIIFSSKEHKIQCLKELEFNMIDTREWWGKGAHEQSAFKNEKISELPNTKLLSETTIGLPFFTDLQEDQIAKIIQICTK